MNLLVTGANGFIGYKLCEKVLNTGWHVRGTVRPSTYRNNLPSGVDVVPIEEIGPLTDWSKVMSGVDTVVHLAARVQVINDIAADVSDAYGSVNVAGTERLARMVAACGIRRFIYLSTVKVNGEGKPSPYTEKDNPTPIDPYGISKWESEKRLHEIIKHTGLEVVILRPPLVYGPGVKANFLRLLNVVERGIPLPLANINNDNSLIYLENLLDAIVTCVNHPKAAGQTFLVSDGEDVSTPELIRRINSALGRPARLFPFPPVMLKMAGIITGKSVAIDRLLGSLTVDCSKIRRELDWQAPFSMEQGLGETAKWYMKRNIQ
jgi:nucleoside-diphosphate-sugar epimerase